MRDVLATIFLRRRQVLFEMDGNGAHALAALRLSQHLGVAIPEWVLAYLNRSAKTVLADASSVTDVAPAFGLHAKGGRFATRRAKLAERNLAICQMVEHFKHCDPATLTIELRDALRLNGEFAVVAEREGLEKETVEEIYYKTMAALGPTTR
jgi:hypothetical protein